MIASVCERATGRNKVGGASQLRLKQQQSHDQSATTALVKETLRKESIPLSPSVPPSSSLPASFQLNSSHSLPPNSHLPTYDSFEMSTAQCEAEDQLELLVMQEEMSALRIGTSSPENWSRSIPSDPSSRGENRPTSDALGGDDDQKLGSSGGRVASPESGVARVPSFPSSLSAEEGALAGSRVTTSAGVGGERWQQLTVDVKEEKERLEDIMAVAQ